MSETTARDTLVLLVFAAPLLLTALAVPLFGVSRRRQHRDTPPPGAVDRVAVPLLYGVLGVSLALYVAGLVRMPGLTSGQFGRALLSDPLDSAVLLVATTVAAVALRGLRAETYTLWAEITTHYADPTAWTTLYRRGPHWRIVMQRAYVERPEVIDALIVALLRVSADFDDFERRIRRAEYPPEFERELGRRYWGFVFGTVRDQMKRLVLDGIFGTPCLVRLGKDRSGAFAELKRALRCRDCLGRGRTGFLQPCSSCGGSGCQSRPCPQCSIGSPLVRTECRTCGGTRLIEDAYPRLLMDRLQYYWFNLTRDAVVGLGLRVAFSRWIHITLGLLAGFGYGMVAVGDRSLGLVDALVGSLFFGAFAVASYVAVVVVLLFMLLTRGTSTFDIEWPLRDAQFGLPFWRRAAGLATANATFIFVAFSLGFPLLVYGREILAAAAPSTAVFMSIGGSLLFLFYAFLGIGSVHGAMRAAKDSKLAELAYDVVGDRARSETLRAAFRDTASVDTWPLDKALVTRLATSFTLPNLLQGILAVFRAVAA